MSERFYPDVLDGLMGVPVYHSHHLERGKVIIGMDVARGMGSVGQMVCVGIGLGRGIPYRSPNTKRGYLVGPAADIVKLLDVTDGKIRWAFSSKCEALDGYPSIPELLPPPRDKMAEDPMANAELRLADGFTD